MSRKAVCFIWLAAGLLAAEVNAESAGKKLTDRQQKILCMPQELGADSQPVIQLVRQDYENLEFGRAASKLPIVIGRRTFSSGLGTHAVSRLRIYSPEPIRQFSAQIGANVYEEFGITNGSVVFTVLSEKGELYRSGVKRVGQEAEQIVVDVNDSKVLALNVDDGGDGPSWDHASWADATITLKSGKIYKVDQLKLGPASFYPFSFKYGGQYSDDLLKNWQRSESRQMLDENREKLTIFWLDPNTRLKVTFDSTAFTDFPAVEWILYFENMGTGDTGIIEDIQSLEMCVESPVSSKAGFRLYKTNGAPSDETDFAASTVVLKKGDTAVMGGGGGRSSNKDFPFFKVESGEGSTIIAVGWSGQWKATAGCHSDERLQISAGIEKTHFLLHPGEKVRMPRMLVLHRDGDTWESNSQFRQLIYKHYAARRDGKRMLPTLYSNTCWARQGFWLNETTAAGEISLISAFAGLGAEAVVTDAGWFEGGWPDGAGNWTVRKDHYPDGMGPVAAAAKEKGIIYGLWFEPERVMENTAFYREHPDWVLKVPAGRPNFYGKPTHLADFGQAEVREYLFNIVKGFMDMPGFRVYRQDFNMDPLEYWRLADAPDRQGIAEMKYITGLYAFWDRIAEAWPDSLRIECASGGRRIDIETVMRMHIHQKSDYSFDDTTNQASLWGLSQYLPNNVVEGVVNRLDEYSFHSAMAGTLDLGWIADANDFDTARAKKLADRYKQIRHLLTGAWYPITRYSRDEMMWLGSQYHRPDLDEGMLAVFRREKSPYRSIEVSLREIKSDATYEVTSDIHGTRQQVQGVRLIEGWIVTLDKPHQSDIIVYKKVPD